jgi:alkanesulfonate monooxygenase SsuD/methylene tetrahydromethanopterin reductase-like flavin-dependent oxidoreductase (luciferase family)
VLVQVAHPGRLALLALVGDVDRRGGVVADQQRRQAGRAIENWYDSGAADGFNIMPPVLPSSLERFVDDVVPILQERGLFRADYAGITLRDHLGLKRPVRS